MGKDLPPLAGRDARTRGSIRREDRAKSVEVGAPVVRPPPDRDEITNNGDLGARAGSFEVRSLKAPSPRLWPAEGTEPDRRIGSVRLELHDVDGGTPRQKHVGNVASINVPPEKDYVVSRAVASEVAGASRDQGSWRCRCGELEDVEPIDKLTGVLGPRRPHWERLLEDMNERPSAQLSCEKRGFLLGECKRSHGKPLGTVNRMAAAGNTPRDQDNEENQTNSLQHSTRRISHAPFRDSRQVTPK